MSPNSLLLPTALFTLLTTTSAPVNNAVAAPAGPVPVYIVAPDCAAPAAQSYVAQFKALNSDELAKGRITVSCLKPVNAP